MAHPNKRLLDTSFARHFSALEDPRKSGMCDHLFLDILVMAMLAVICGADGWDEFRDFAKAKRKWLATFLSLPAGIPSADTFRRVLARLDPRTFEAAFRCWVAELMATRTGRLMAIDGKSARGSAHRSPTGRALHLVHAWATENQLLLGQYATDQKSNEITAIPELLAVLDLEGAIVTIDAAGCQTEIAHRIVSRGGEYIFTVKENQPTLYKAIEAAFADAGRLAPSDICGWDIQIDDGHGRHEVRRVWSMAAPHLPTTERWEGLKGCIKIEADRTVKGKTSSETRYFISSLPHDDTARLGRFVRSHWGIENSLHWRLDVAFREDASEVHAGKGPEILALLRRIALTALQRDKIFKAGMGRRRKRAGWDNDYLLEILTGEFVQE